MMKFLCVCLATINWLVWPNFSLAADIDSATTSNAAKMSVVGCISWWSHDAVGYHPTLLLKVENSSNTNLTGELLRFQGRFTDMRTGYVSVARKELRQDFASHRQIYLALRAPTAVELPIDDSAWPSIECKVMCRIGTAGDDGTQDLLITHLDAITMSDEEAFSLLAKQTGFGKVNPAGNNTKTVQVLRPSAKALTVDLTVPPSAKPLAGDLTVPPSLPGIGDDFYQFEKFFGQPAPADIIASREDLTWASYPASKTFSHVIVGSRNTSGKADIIIISLPPLLAASDRDLLSLATALLAKTAKQKITPFVHSVKYLPTGRCEINRASAADCQVVSFKLPASTNEASKTVLVVSRLPADLETTLSSYVKKVTLLQVLKPGLALNND